MLPDVNKEFVLRTDASDIGLGATLLQNRDGHIFPVAYASRKLLDREKRYSVKERECLGIVWGIKKFALCLYSKQFTLQTTGPSNSSRFLNVITLVSCVGYWLCRVMFLE